LMCTLHPWPLKRVAEHKENNEQAERLTKSTATSENSKANGHLARFDRSIKARYCALLLVHIETPSQQTRLFDCKVRHLQYRKPTWWIYTFYKSFDTRSSTTYMFNTSYSTSTTYSIAQHWSNQFKTHLHTESSQLLDFYTYLTRSTTTLAVEIRSTLGKHHGNTSRLYAVRSHLTCSFEATSMVSDLWSRSVIAQLGRTPAKCGNMTLNILFLAFFYHFIV